jgi:hypothetical protein
MIRRIAKFGTIGVVAAILGGEGLVNPGEPELARLKTHVETLASPEFAGRRGEGAAKARGYLIQEFKKLKLEPLFGDSYTQTITGKGLEDVLGVNVGVKIVGSDPALADQWVILGTHYDHLGQLGEVIFPGADDNASGVAMMLEVARTIAESPQKPRRSIAFVGFDLEERGPKGEFGLRGSQFFARHPPVALDEVCLFVTADMIGRSLGGVLESTAFVLGSEHEPEVRPWISKAAEGKPVKLALLGSDMLVIDRSDYGPFRSRKIPYLFFTTGESQVYHTPQDVAETIEYPKLEAISQMIAGVIRESLNSPVKTVWAPVPDYPVVEALAVRDVFQTLLVHKEAFSIGAYQLSLMNQTIGWIDEIERRGSMTAAERSRIARTAQIIMFTVL